MRVKICTQSLLGNQMAIIVIGLNHKRAPLHIREKLFFSTDRLGLYLKDLLQGRNTHEAVLLSTCNRSELYCEADNLAEVKTWFSNQVEPSSDRALVEDYLYVYENQAAVEHIMQVACGLDSMILGEPQILGQMKQAFSESVSVLGVGTVFHRLFQQVFTVAKEVRTVTAIGACPVSVASAAVNHARAEVPALELKKIALVGAGETGTLLLKYLTPYTKAQIYLVNRHHDKAHELALNYGAIACPMDKLHALLQDVDVVFTATGSPHPIIQPHMLFARDKLLTIIDLAVPRDVAPEVNDLPMVQLYCIDHLKKIIERNRLGREHAAEKALEMVKREASEFIRHMHTLDRVTYTIRAYRTQIEELCQQELLKAKEALYTGRDPVDVLEVFAHAFTKKLLHTPSVQLRQAGAEGKFEILRLAQQLFAIPD